MKKEYGIEIAEDVYIDPWGSKDRTGDIKLLYSSNGVQALLDKYRSISPDKQLLILLKYRKHLQGFSHRDPATKQVVDGLEGAIREFEKTAEKVA